ncbi:MAG: sigma-70 family RNA polymerase sigma factor [Breznakia sp.]
MNKERDEHELIYMYRQGDEDALFLLIKKYKRILYAIARRHIRSVKTSCEIEDLYQIGLIAFYGAIDTYKENMGSKFATYTKVVVDRAMYNYLRHSYSNIARANRDALSMEQAIHDQEGIYLIDTIVSQEKAYDPVWNMDMDYVYAQINEVLIEMPFLSKKVFHFWCLGYSYQEIAHACALSEKKVDNILHQVKKKIREHIRYKI